MGECCSVQRQHDESEILMSNDPKKQPIRGGFRAESLAPQALSTHGAAVHGFRGKAGGGGSPPPLVSDAAVKEFLDRASSKGIEVVVLLASGVGVEVEFKVDVEREVIELKKDELRKEIKFSQISSILYTPSDLKRIKTEAPLDDHCSAIFLKPEDSCIVFSFDTLKQNHAFIQAATKTLKN